MSVVARHRSYLQMRFELDVDGAAISAAEIKLLAKYGNWLKALENGELPPITPEQKRFHDVIAKKVPPSNVIEAAWLNYKRRKQALAEMQDIPHYGLRDERESWYAEAAYRQGIHFPRGQR
jgi:uncharacterized protein YifE (UPF0438 family)